MSHPKSVLYVVYCRIPTRSCQRKKGVGGEWAAKLRAKVAGWAYRIEMQTAQCTQNSSPPRQTPLLPALHIFLTFPAVLHPLDSERRALRLLPVTANGTLLCDQRPREPTQHGPATATPVGCSHI